MIILMSSGQFGHCTLAALPCGRWWAVCVCVWKFDATTMLTVGTWMNIPRTNTLQHYWTWSTNDSAGVDLSSLSDLGVVSGQRLGARTPKQHHSIGINLWTGGTGEVEKRLRCLCLGCVGVENDLQGVTQLISKEIWKSVQHAMRM